MARVIHALMFGAASAIVALAAASCLSASELSLCDAGQDAGTLTGRFLGETPKDPITAPYTVSGELTSAVAIDVLTLGGVPVTAATGATNYRLWSVALTKDQLEANRDGAYAKLELVATTVCNTTTTVATRSVPIGPNPNTPITSLLLEPIEPPLDECYLPVNGSKAARVRVTAGIDFVGAPVSLSATNGTLTPASPVKLVAGDGKAFYDLTFTGGSAGAAVVAAAGQGYSAQPVSVLVADKPLLSPAEATAVRGVPYSVFVSSAGNLDTCRVEASYADAATVEVVNPPSAPVPIIDVTSVKDPKVECLKSEQLRVHVTFAPSAPTGAVVTLRCADTWGQEGSAKITVSGDPLVPIAGLSVQAKPPLGECYLPANGSKAATVKITADPSFVGASVNVTATNGTLTPMGPVKLIADGTNASYELSFSGSSPGIAIIAAAGQGASAEPAGVRVAAKPQISPPSGSAKRGVPYSLYVLSDGNLDSCRAEPTNAGTVSLEIADPPLGPLTGIKSVKQPNIDCSVPELLRVDVSFAAGAPDGSSVTLRCVDTWGQEGSSTVTVMNAPQ